MKFQFFHKSKQIGRPKCVLRWQHKFGMWLTVWLFFLHFSGYCRSESSNDSPIVILKSKELVPYNLAQEGFQDVVGKDRDSVFILDDKSLKTKQIFSEIHRRSPRLLHVIGTPAARLAVSQNVNLPVVFSMILNPEIVADIEGPVASCIALPAPYALFQNLQNLMPDVERIGTVYNPDNTTFLVTEGQKVAGALGLELTALPVSSLGDALKSLEKLSMKVDAMWLLPDRTVMTPQSFEFMLLTSFRKRIPLIAISEKYVQQGALMTLKVDYQKMGRQAGRMAEQILSNSIRKKRITVFARGSKLVINMKTAEKLGIRVPPSILEEASVIKK